MKWLKKIFLRISTCGWRTAFSRVFIACGIVFGLGLLVLAIAFATWPWRKRHILGYTVRINVPADYRGCPDLRFHVSGASPTRAEGGMYIVDLPQGGKWHTSTELFWGESLDFEYFRLSQSGFVRLHPRPTYGGTTTFPDGSISPVPRCVD